MALSARQRRPLPSEASSSSSSPASYTKLDKPKRSDGGEEADKGLTWALPLFALGVLRYMSATSNIIHDCDEVFNYWEPLHFLLFKSGFQTWEYSSQYALRSYLYLLFHKVVGGPASWLFSDEKVRVFYAVRIFLGLLSVITEAALVVALSRKYGKRLASYALAMLCVTSGCFFASTSFLPSSFSMYAMSLSSALFLFEKPAMAVAVAAIGVILGWPFSVLAFLPITIYSLIRRFKQSFLAGAITSIVLLALSLLVDYTYYRRWTSSVLNVVLYNVLGGGESHLYGTEGPLYYLKNGFNNFNFCFILALLFVGVLPVARKKYAPDLFLVVSPIYIWLAFMSLQPHKEERIYWATLLLSMFICDGVDERHPEGFLFLLSMTFWHDFVNATSSFWFHLWNLKFHGNMLSHSMDIKYLGFLYPIYPLICVAAAAVIESFPDFFRDKYNPNHNSLLIWIAQTLRPLVLGLILCISHARTFSLIHGYSAPLEIYKHLDYHDHLGTGSVVCVGSEWHRFPSSFFIPDHVGQVRWIDDGFSGLLPFPFNSTLGGTSAAPPYFNNKNKASDEQYLQDLEKCTFLIELHLQRPYPYRGSDLSTWEIVAALPYLDRELSPPMYRSFFIPLLWQEKNVFGIYKLLQRIPK